MQPCLLVVRLRRSALREMHKLAYCVPLADEEHTKITYADGEEILCHVQDLIKAVHVNEKTMLAHGFVFDTVVRDCAALQSKLPVHIQVCFASSHAT